MTISETVFTRAPSVIKKYWYLFALALIALFSFGLNFFAIGKAGYCNAYYAAAIRSMTESFRNFFYVSFDPAGLVSVDKPPLGLWVQALFVLIFGYHGWAMLLPQALAATGSAIMMYILTARYFGRPAGLLAALIFAVTPAVVVAARNNTMDTQLVLVLLAAVWFLLKSIEMSKRRYLLVCAVFIGLGFNIKMLEAYMLLPAVILVYLIFDRQPLPKRFAAGAAAFLVMLAVSSAWALAVELTPADARPYVGSSDDNTMAQLILGHNGLDRFYGAGTVGSIISADTEDRTDGVTSGGQAGRTVTPRPYAFGVKTPGNDIGAAARTPQISWADFSALTAGSTVGTNQNDIGHPGLLRLWELRIFGQITWLFVLVPFCVLVLAGSSRPKDRSMRLPPVVLWLAWLVTLAVFFSYASFWHLYYLCIAAPAVAGLVGAGLPELYRSFRERKGWKQFLLPAALLCTVTPEILFIREYETLRTWLLPLTIIPAAAALLLMAVYLIKPVLPCLKSFTLYAAPVLMFAALLAGPAYWSLTAVLYVAPNSTLPYAGPELALPAGRYATPNQEALTTGDSGTLALEKYLTAHYKPGSYLVVAQRANDVAEFIVHTGLPAVAYGGFLGTDKAITLDSFMELVARGKITYVLMSWRTAPVNSGINAYIWERAQLVAPSEYLGASETGSLDGEALFLFS